MLAWRRQLVQPFRFMLDLLSTWRVRMIDIRIQCLLIAHSVTLSWDCAALNVIDVIL